MAAKFLSMLIRGLIYFPPVKHLTSMAYADLFPILLHIWIIFRPFENCQYLDTKVFVGFFSCYFSREGSLCRTSTFLFSVVKPGAVNCYVMGKSTFKNGGRSSRGASLVNDV